MKEVSSLWVSFFYQKTLPVNYSCLTPAALQPGKGWALLDCQSPRDGALYLFIENSCPEITLTHWETACKPHNLCHLLKTGVSNLCFLFQFGAFCPWCSRDLCLEWTSLYFACLAYFEALSSLRLHWVISHLYTRICPVCIRKGVFHISLPPEGFRLALETFDLLLVTFVAVSVCHVLTEALSR